MLRLLLAALTLVLALETSGIAAYALDAACDEACSADASDRDCPPDCSACVCCAHPRVVAPTTPPALPPPAGERANVPFDPTTPPSTDPAEILHVPRLALA